MPQSAAIAPTMKSVAKSLWIGNNQEEREKLLGQYRALTGCHPANVLITNRELPLPLTMASPPMESAHLLHATGLYALPPASSSMLSLRQLRHDQREAINADPSTPNILQFAIDHVAATARRAHVAEMKALRAKHEFEEATNQLVLIKHMVAMSGEGVSSTLPPASSFSSSSPPSSADVATAALMLCQRSSSINRHPSLKSQPPVQKTQHGNSSSLFPQRVTPGNADVESDATMRCLNHGHNNEARANTDSLEVSSSLMQGVALEDILKKHHHQMSPSSLEVKEAYSGETNEETTEEQQPNTGAKTATESNAKNANSEVDVNELVTHVFGECKNQPRRPLSAYNFFYSEECKAVLLELSLPLTDPDENEESVLNRVLGNTISVLDRNQKATYRGVATVEQFEELLSRSLNQHRDRRKLQSKIGLRALAKLIGIRWRALSPGMRRHFHCFAKMDLARYKHEVALASK